MIITIPAYVLTKPIEAIIEKSEYAKWEIALNIDLVSVSPTVDVAKGVIQQFTATVDGTDNPDLTVTTTIALNGKLSISADETAETLTVTSTSTYDNTKIGTAIVTVVKLYPIIEGANGNLGFIADADYDKFENVEVDGEVLSSSDYTSEEGARK